MEYFQHVFVSFSGIASAIGWVFAVSFIACLIAIIVLIGSAMQRLRHFGCEQGFAGKIKDCVESSVELAGIFAKGNVSDPYDREKILGGIFCSCQKHRLFYDFLGRFISRRFQKPDLQPSLQSLSNEFAAISRIQRSITAIRCISSVLPAVGLLGTLMGMFGAFTGTDFDNPDVRSVMTALMHNFGTALWTTILAVIIKIWADLWCHFGPQRKVAIMTNEIVQLKYYILDMIESQDQFTNHLTEKEIK